MENTASRRVLIVGGGAGGLAAAVAAGELGARVTVAERQNRVGQKLLRTGNGRCNLSNAHVSPQFYNRPDFVSPVLSQTGCAELREYFSSLGLWTTEDAEGRIYPRSDTASSVLDVLRLGCSARGVSELCSTEITGITPTKKGFRLAVREGEALFAERVIIASGGGTALLKQLGHSYVPFSPVLCPLKTDVAPIRGLSGLRAKCAVRLLRNGKSIYEEAGELLFRDYGVSGILALNLSRYARGGDELSVDFLPEFTLGELREKLVAQSALPREKGEVLTGVFHRRIGEAISRASEGDIAQTAKDFRLKVLGCGDVKNAQVTRGGADTAEFDPRTLESRLVPGLYCIGEALDVDGACGGFNLHWAFASGLTAGRSAAND